jgi:hypothetical protein
MESMQAHRFGWLFGAAALLSANAASAQECAKDADCGDGYVCKTGMTPACAEKPCPPDDPKCNNLPPDCGPTEYHYCEAKPCSADSDCPDTMVCHSETYSECSGGSATPQTCPKDGACPPPEPVPADTCKDTTVSTCTPRWALPCKQDADCGAGFDCKEQLIGMCSGSSGAPAAGSGSAGSADGGVPAAEPPPPQETCTTEPSGEFYCELKDLPCATDDDCPSGLQCADSYAGVACASPATPSDTPKAGSGSGSAGAGDAPQDAGAADAPVDTCADMKPKKVCAPPSYYGRGIGIADSAQAGGAAGDPTSVDKGGKSDSENGAEPPAAPEPGNTHSASGSGDDGSSMMKTNSGCAVTAPGSNGAGVLGFLSVLGLSVLALRRRKA